MIDEPTTMSFEEWERTVSAAITGDPLWKMTAYRLAILLADIAWHDVTKLLGDQRTCKISDQLNRAIGSIGANLAEGYSRSTGKDRARFYEYALGSARESRHWYYQGRRLLSSEIFEHRVSLLEQVIRLLITMVPQQRKQGGIRENETQYEIASEHAQPGSEAPPEKLQGLPDTMPLPMQ